MAHPDDRLAPGERVAIRRHPHWKALFAPLVVLVAVALGGTWLAGPVSALPWATTAWAVLAAVAGVLVAWLVVAPVLRWGTTRFTVTTERVMCRVGVVRRARLNLPLGMVRGARFEQGRLDRLLGCGTLVVDSDAEEPLEFDDIPGVAAVHAALCRELDAGQDRAGQDRAGQDRSGHQQDRSTNGRA